MTSFSRLGEGKFFGELALQVNDGPLKKNITRAATVKSIT